jgi:hypothetical protein
MDHKKAIKIGFTSLILCLIGLCLVPLVVAEDSGAGYYDGKWGTGLSVAKINYYGNQSGL